MLNEKNEKKLTTMVNDLIVTGNYVEAKKILDQTSQKEYKHFDKYMNMLQTYQKQNKKYNKDTEYSPSGV